MHSYPSRLLPLRHGDSAAGASRSRRNLSRVQTDFRNLLDRVNRRLYPETIPVLASYWLKTVYWGGYTRENWRELDKLLRRESQTPSNASEAWRQAVSDIRAWIQEYGRKRRSKPDSADTTPMIRRPALGVEALSAYAARLLNEWLPQEVSRLLIREPEAGIPALTIGRALERLLLRDRLSISTLESLLNPELLPARLAYPADGEILRDVVLFLLRRTESPAPAVMPATLLATTPDSRLPYGYADDVANAYLVATPQSDEVHVPAPPDRVRQVLAETPARIGSILVTADGRCWEAARLEEGSRNVIVYLPHSRLRLDDSHDHLRLRVPWPDHRRSWTGAAGLPAAVEVFGRRWKVASWERDSAHTWLNLIFFEVLPGAVAGHGGSDTLRRSGPASADLAWAELEDALAIAVARNDWASIERLQREDLIPLGRALVGLAQFFKNPHSRDRETLATHLHRLEFQLAKPESAYGRIPWRILPAPFRNSLLRSARLDPALLETLGRIFAEVPKTPAPVSVLRSLARFAGRPESSGSVDNYKSA